MEPALHPGGLQPGDVLDVPTVSQVQSKANDYTHDWANVLGFSGYKLPSW